MFLSISHTNAVILSKFYKVKIRIIYSYAIMTPMCFKNIIPIIYINGVAITIFIQEYYTFSILMLL
jgi:hypothetical protein